MTDIKRMNMLRVELAKASNDYYNGVESMSNFEYDQKFDELKILEEQYGNPLENFTDKVGADVEPQNGLAKVVHEYEAKSLGKTKFVDELIKEQSKTSDGFNGETCLSWKLDGCTIQLTYNKGELQLACTRGDGKVGQDITKNSIYIEGIPQKIDYLGKLVVRGEALMSYAEFDRLNTDGQYANPRNLASATITALDAKLLIQRHINFKAFELVYADIMPAITFNKRLMWLRQNKFDVVPHEVVKIADLKDAVARWSEVEKINNLDFPVDGLVVAFNNVEKVKDFEGTEHHPSLTKAMAFKWQDEKVKTKLLAIEWSPSRTALLNPVAIFNTVDLCGTRVSRASLHNLTYIKNLNLKIGDNITVYKANMIIPQIAENLDRDKGTADLRPVNCPCCNELATIKDNDGTLTMVCGNENCIAKRIGTFTHFVEKHGMNIEGLSEKTLLTLIENGIISELADLYRLGEKDRQAFVNIEGLGDKAFDNLLANIEKSRTTDVEHFLYACGINGISRGQIKEIVGFLKVNYNGALKGYQNVNGNYNLLDMLRNMEEDRFDFTCINGIGDVLAKNLSDFIEKEFIESEHGKGYNACLKYIHFIDEPETIGKDLPLLGKTFVITGTLNNFANRDELISVIEINGGKVSSNVSKNTDFLINNDSMSTSGKNKKAQDLGIPIISEADFVAKISIDK